MEQVKKDGQCAYNDPDVSIGVGVSNMKLYREEFKRKSEILLDQGRFHDFHILFNKYLNWS